MASKKLTDGVVYLPRSMIFNDGLSSNEKLVMIALKCFSQGSTCYPSKESIGKAMGISEKTVQRAWRTLEEKGYIIVEAQGKGGKGINSTTVYRIADQFLTIKNS